MTQPSDVAAGAGPVEPATADVYSPYGQLIKMLLPRSGSVAFYGADKDLLWCSEGYERPDLRALVDELSEGNTEYLSSRGTTRSMGDDASAFLYALRGQSGQVLGTVVLELPDEPGAQRRGSMVASLLRPVLDCLENRIDIERTVVDQEDAQDDGDLGLLLAADDSREGQAGALERLVKHCVQHLDSVLGALIIPEKNLTICCAADDAKQDQGPALLSRTHKHLLAWAQLNNRPMVVNHVSPDSQSTVPAFKILSCPVRDPNDRVAGLFALFRAADAADFEMRDTRIIEFMSRKAVNLLHSHYDPLTGLMTRLAFERSAQTTLDEVSAQPGHSFLHIDIDQINVINDAFGFQAGDEVIQRLAELIRAELTPTDLAGRIGGDRFAVLLPGQAPSQAEAVAERLREAMGRLGYLNGEQSVPVSISVGVAGCASQGQPAAHALAAAELACKRAKARGRNGVEMYREDPAAMLQRRGDVFAFATLQDALKGNQFRLDAQPIHALADTDSILGYEILVRMRNEAGDLVAPDKFMAAARRYHLTPALDRWVLCSTLDVVTDRAHQIPSSAMFAVNVTAQSVSNESFREFLLEQLRESKLPPESFCLEIAESAAVANLRQAEALIREVTELGCTVALDDFGAGLSSLAHLKSLPVDYLKIDGSFVRRILTDQFAESMVLAIAQAAKTLGIQTIAEHVEEAAVAVKLRGLGVDYAQGYFFARPESLARVLAELSPVPFRSRASAS